VENKEAETVEKAIFSEWFCKFGIPAQIHTDGKEEFVNKLSNKLFTLLNVKHTMTTLAHPQCNAQVEVFNKTVKKYLASFVDDTTLDWGKLSSSPDALLQHELSLHHCNNSVKTSFWGKPQTSIFPKSGHSTLTLQ
jgi:hypothetical protein